MRGGRFIGRPSVAESVAGKLDVLPKAQSGSKSAEF